MTFVKTGRMLLYTVSFDLVAKYFLMAVGLAAVTITPQPTIISPVSGASGCVTGLLNV